MNTRAAEALSAIRWPRWNHKAGPGDREDGGVHLSSVIVEGWKWLSILTVGSGGLIGSLGAVNCSGEGRSSPGVRGSPQGPAPAERQRSQSSRMPWPAAQAWGWLPNPAGAVGRVCVVGTA